MESLKSTNKYHTHYSDVMNELKNLQILSTDECKNFTNHLLNFNQQLEICAAGTMFYLSPTTPVFKVNKS